jgi:hypothetical protein
MRTNLSTYLRDEYKGLRFRTIDEIFNILVANDESLQLHDNRGSLCYNVIDDQQSEMIHSIEIVRYPDEIKPPKVMAWIGVYEEDNTVDIEEFSYEMLLNVLEAAEKAIE